MNALACSVALIVLSHTSPTGLAEDYPTRLAGILSPGQGIALTQHSDSGEYALTIYDERTYEIMRDSKLLSSEEFDEKYPDVAEQKREFLAAGPPPIVANVQDYSRVMAIVSVPSRVRFFEVTHAGEDYFVVTPTTSNGAVMGVPYSKIRRIYWINEIKLSWLYPEN